MDAPRLRPLRVGETIDVGITIYRQRYAALLPAVCVVVLPVALLTTLVDLSIPDSVLTTDYADTADYVEPDGGEVAATFAGLLVSALLTWLAVQVATAACFEIVGGAYLGRSPTWRDSLRFAAARLRSLVWLQTIFLVAVGLGTLACLVPGVHLYVAFAVATPVLLFEGLKGRKALRRSRALVKGRWWPTCGILILLLIMSGIVQAVLTGVVVAVVLGGGGEFTETVVAGLASAVATVLTTPLGAAVTTVLYFDTLVRKEGFDLLQLARGIGVDPPAGWQPEPVAPLMKEPPAWTGDDQPPFWPPPPGWKPRSERDS